MISFFFTAKINIKKIYYFNVHFLSFTLKLKKERDRNSQANARESHVLKFP